MYYIINSEEKIIGCCDFEPNKADLENRNEYCLFSEVNYNDISNIEVLEGIISIKQPAPKTQEEVLDEKIKLIVTKRNTLLSETDWMFNRHLEQTMLNISTNLTEIQFTKLIEYRQSLRDITNTTGFPEVEFPVLNLEE